MKRLFIHTPSSTTPKIGIFWVYRQTVLGQAIELCAGEAGVPGILDSPATHVRLWEQLRHRTAAFPELRDVEYDRIPRGRVLWQQQLHQAIVYLDARLFNLEDMARIKAFFWLDGVTVTWQRDAHYTTQQSGLSPAAEDDF